MGKSNIAGVILAAGQSSRMGAENKLVRPWRGRPLVRHVYDAANTSRLQKIAVVTGHEEESVKACLPHDAPLTVNGDYAKGMAGSIRAGLYRLQGHGPVMILLGDMPLVTSDHIDALIKAFENAANDEAIIAATCKGNIGNPVLFGKQHFAALKMLEGDEGAGAIVRAAMPITVEIGEAARRDFDTVQAFEVN